MHRSVRATRTPRPAISALCIPLGRPFNDTHQTEPNWRGPTRVTLIFMGITQVIWRRGHGELCRNCRVMQICQAWGAFGTRRCPWIVPPPPISGLQRGRAAVCARPWTRANLSSSQYVSTLMKTKISAAPHKYAYRRPLWGRVRPCRNIFTRSSASCSRIRHLIISKRAKPDAPQAAIHEWQTKKKKTGESCRKYTRNKKTTFFFSMLSQTFPGPLKHTLEFDARRMMFFFFLGVKKHRHLHTVLVLSLSRGMYQPRLQCGANGSDSSLHSLLVSFSI